MILEQNSKVLNIYIYEGSENSFLINRVYSTKWLCSYDMLFYPFDTQVNLFIFSFDFFDSSSWQFFFLQSCYMLLTPSGNSATQVSNCPLSNHLAMTFCCNLKIYESLHILHDFFLMRYSYSPNFNLKWNFFVQLQLIPSNHTYSGDKELTQYFIRSNYEDLI